MIRFAPLVVLVTVGCTDPRDITPPGEDVSSKAERITQAAPDVDLEAASAANTALALSLLARHPHGNFLFSPSSITTATSMVEVGARGNTRVGIIKALQQTLPEAQHHRAMNTLEAAIESRGVNAKGKDGRPFRLVATNQLFAKKGQHFEQPYLDTLAQEYGAGVRLLDFSTDAARVSINQWVSQRTEGKIGQLFAPNALAGVSLAVVNTLYFNAAWDEVFDKASTQPYPFTLLDGSKPEVTMMRNSKLKGAKAALVDGTQVLELLYDGQDVSLVVLAPPVGKFADVVGGLDAAKLHDLVKRAEPHLYDVRLPKFEFANSFELVDDLKALGMADAFDASRADFSGMTGKPELYVPAAVHQAIIILDENGTEAAAATSFGFAPTALPQSTEVIIDRPFLFFIRDVKTGLVLFAGRVVDPR